MNNQSDVSLIRIWRVGALALTFALRAGIAHATIPYSISLSNPESHLFHVDVTLPDIRGEVIVQMPAWNATYQVRDFSSRIRDLRADMISGERLPITQLDKQTWRISCRGIVVVSYAVYWDEGSPFSSQLNSSHAFMNLAEILLYAPGRRMEDVHLSVFWDARSKWKAATSLRAAGNGLVRERSGLDFVSAHFTALNYDQLVDAPVEFSEFQDFTLAGISPPVHVMVHGDNWNKGELSSALARIVRYETDLMGGAPYENYTFIFHIGLNSGTGGGMEHANSTAINAVNDREAIATAAHEFFHTWNVKRIRPRTLEPIDYTQEMWTRALWFAEGLTSTYASYTEVRTGLWTRQQFYSDLGQQITMLQSRPARFWQSAEESSLSAWLEKYPQYNRPTISISYYNKGQLIGVLLDILIRDATDNHKSLDDVMRSLNENFARKGLFYNDSEDIEATVDAIAGQSSATFFERYVAGTDEVPFADLLYKAGFAVTPAYAATVDAGFETASNFEGTQVDVVSVKLGGAADRAGIRVGDSILSINGEAHFWLEDHQPGETIKVVLSRGGREMKISLTLGAQTVQAFRIAELQSPNDKQRRIREGMLKGTTN
jgi:predicted metalloprotease with PDZ domain